MTAALGWGRIARLTLVQACIGALVVLAISTFNRIMTVELALPALVPGLLVAWHYTVQLLRPRLGHGADVSGRASRWIMVGMVVLALGTVLAAGALGLMRHERALGLGVAVLAYGLIGVGVGAAGTALLAALASAVAPQRRAAAATLSWIMLIVGFAATTAIAGEWLAPYSQARLLRLTIAVALCACGVCLAALRGIVLGGATAGRDGRPAERRDGFAAALREVWRDRRTRRFTLFVFLSMLAYSGQELTLEPFCGAVLGLTPAGSAAVSACLNVGALAGMVAVALLAGGALRGRLSSLEGWTAAGCLGSALAITLLALLARSESVVGVKLTVFGLGVANGAFTVGAIGLMMALTAPQPGTSSRPGVRVGIWGAAQALAFALGGLIGTAVVDFARLALGTPASAYLVVFAIEAALFIVAARFAPRGGPAPAPETIGRKQAFTPSGTQGLRP